MRATVDGNEAAASVAYRLNEVCCIYPITPSSTMAELADEWASQERPNVWGTVPVVVEMQSEGGAAGALHGALQSGALATTFTASQGLLLMIPNMYKIAGELTPAVFHVAARSLAAQGLSIFGDHSDVMAVRQTGLRAARLGVGAGGPRPGARGAGRHAPHARPVRPFLRRLPHVARAEHDRAALRRRPARARARRSSFAPTASARSRRSGRSCAERRRTRTSYFQARETVNPFYARVPDVVEEAMAALAERTGRRYGIVDYHGHPEAERVLVLMGSGAETVGETVAHLNGNGERVGVAQRAALPAVPRAGAGRRAPGERPSGRSPRPDEGAGLPRRAALPRHGRRR